MSSVRPHVQHEVRTIAVEDAESFHACLDLVAREGTFLALLQAPPLEELKSFVRGNIERGVPQVVALAESRVVGWCDIVPGWHHTLRHCGSLGMGLLPEYRGRGLGRELFQECLQLAVQAGVTRVELEAREDNERALHLYRQLGFTVEGRKVRGMRVNGEYVGTIAMSLLV
jgi:ribosomal protein S18 acetylase RimI-like enzyme